MSELEPPAQFGAYRWRLRDWAPWDEWRYPR
jgi:hypothetical protein